MIEQPEPHHPHPSPDFAQLILTSARQLLFGHKQRRQSLDSMLLFLASFLLQKLDHSVDLYLWKLRVPFIKEQDVDTVITWEKSREKASKILLKSNQLNKASFRLIRSGLRRWMGAEKCPLFRRLPTMVVYYGGSILFQCGIASSVIFSLIAQIWIETITKTASQLRRFRQDYISLNQLVKKIRCQLVSAFGRGREGMADIIRETTRLALSSNKKAQLRSLTASLCGSLAPAADRLVGSGRLMYQKVSSSYLSRRKKTLQAIYG